jgi:hypothetical protein
MWCSAVCSTVQSSQLQHCALWRPAHDARVQLPPSEERAVPCRQLDSGYAESKGEKPFEYYMDLARKMGKVKGKKKVDNIVFSPGQDAWARKRNLRSICALLLFLPNTCCIRHATQVLFFFGTASARCTLGCCDYNFCFFQNKFSILYISAGMKSNAQHELLHALHCAFLRVESPDFEESSGSFTCQPSTMLPAGGLSPIRHICVLLNEGSTDSDLRNTLGKIKTDGREDDKRLASFLKISISPCMTHSWGWGCG